MEGRSGTRAAGAATRPGRAHGGELPAGLVTFVFTDIEGSTALFRRLGARYAAVLERHRAIVREAVAAHHGFVVGCEGDSFFLVFADAAQALAAACELQRRLGEEHWPAGNAVRVRSGAHSAQATPRGTDYVALGVHQAKRVCAAAHGGQVLVSSTTARLARHRLPAGLVLADIGRYVLRDFVTPQVLHQVHAATLARDFPAPRTASAARHNLPVERTSFVGRAEDIATLGELIESERLVTITGSGGVGKTRLALEVAGGLVDAFADGVWFVELAPLAGGPAVAGAVASVLGVGVRGGRELIENVLRQVADRSLLLVLDNCEHVIGDCAELVDRLLEAAGVRVLATSREPLGVAGERVWRAPSLPLDDAVRLFSERSATRRAGGPDAAAARSVAEICTRLDGIPLAIELAAASTRSLGVRELATRLNDRFRILGPADRAALPRHRTLRALVEWSHDLLSERERVLFRRLSVFAGGCTLEEAERTCSGELLPLSEIVVQLGGLVDKSLLQTAPGVTGAQRYTMLETLRLYGAERLEEAGEAQDAQRHHLRAMASFARSAGEGLRGLDFQFWLSRFDEEAANVAAAMQWQLDDGEARQLRLEVVVGCADYWNLRSAAAAIGWWARVIDESRDLDPMLHLEAQLGLAGLLTNENEPRQVRGMLEAICAHEQVVGPCGLVARAHAVLAWADVNDGLPEDARGAIQRALDMADAVGDPLTRTLVPLYASSVYANLGDTDAALTAARAAVEGAERGGFARNGINAAIDLGWVHLVRGELDDAEPPTQRAIDESSAAGSPGLESSARLNLGHIRRLRGDAEGARDQYIGALLAARAASVKRDAAEALEGLAVLAAGDGDMSRAAELFGTAERLRDVAYPMEEALRPVVEAAMTAVRTALGHAPAAALWARGRSLGVDEVDSLARLENRSASRG